MSADLLAEFGFADTASGSGAKDKNQSSAKPPWPTGSDQPLSDDWSTSNVRECVLADTSLTPAEDDGWGDFEDAASDAPPEAVVATTPQTTVVTPSFPRQQIYRASTFDLITNNLVNLEVVSPQESRGPKRALYKAPLPSWSEAEPAKQASTRADTDVLFDADDFDDQDLDENDDFGDFETGHAASVPKSSDLLHLDKESPEALTTPSSVMSLPKLSAVDNGNSSTLQATTGDALASLDPWVMTPSIHETQSTEAVAAHETLGHGRMYSVPPGVSSTKPNGSQAEDAWSDDDWDDMQDRAPTKDGSVATSKTMPTLPATPLAQDAISDMAPPTNVPPPTILLAFLAEVLQSSCDALAGILSQPDAVRIQVMADPGTLSFVTGFIALAQVAGRVVAGRKLRWHRDKFLSASMSFSAAGSKRGMKLAGLDKSQVSREDREAAEFVATWKNKIAGRLRSAVAAGKGRLSSARVPEINEHMVVQTSKPGTAPVAAKACIVCGLKREERTKGVDFDVDDSFGEWWTEHWGHWTCANFWKQHEKALRQR